MPDDKWVKFHRLVKDTVALLRAADGDQEKIQSAIRRYLGCGRTLEMSPTVLWDSFPISSPGMPEKAGYCGYEAEKIVALFGRISNELFGGD